MNAKSCRMLSAGFVCALLLAGCSIDVHKGTDGEDKRVKIDTPLGNIHVNTDKAAGDTGLESYPGAQSVADHDGDKNANVRLGFGDWQLRVDVEHYSTDDSRDKVMAFYRKSMSRFGDVIECKGETPVGTPTRTSEGLTCEEHDAKRQFHTSHDEVMLRAGSKRHQHLVIFDKDSKADQGPTRFSLIALDLPQDDLKKGRETD